MLLIFGGLPANGKSTISKRVAQELNATYIRVDTFEQTLMEIGYNTVHSEGYELAYRVATENLSLGSTVVADSVNSIEVTRSAWRKVGEEAKVPVLEIEIICSDRVEHKRRVESRVTDIEQSTKVTWEDVLNRNYEHWLQANIVIDTAGVPVDQSVVGTLSLINEQ